MKKICATIVACYWKRNVMRMLKRGRLIVTFIIIGASSTIAQPRLAEDVEIASLRPRFVPKNPTVEIVEPLAPVVTVNKAGVVPTEDVTKRLNKALDSVYVHNKQIKYASGFRVLVFSGTDKTEMNVIKQKVYKAFPDIEIYTEFKQPEYRIAFGDFIDKLEAHNHLVKIRPAIPDALIVQEQINIKRKQ